MPNLVARNTYYGEVRTQHHGISAINKTGGTLAKGALVYVSGWDDTSKRFKISKATATAGGRSVAVLTAAVLDGATTVARSGAIVTGLDTSGKTVGDAVYLDTVAGGYTYTKPLTNIQIVGFVYKVDASDGAIQFDVIFTGSPGISEATETAPAGASTAAAGTDSATATVLPAATAKVYPTTGADNTKGVRMHATDKVTGRMVYIGNGVSTTILKVYAPTGGTINGAATDIAFSSVAGKGVIMYCLDSAANTWLAW